MMTIFTRCKATLNQATMLVPDKPKPLREMCLDGAKALGVEMTPEYIERMDYELGVIESKGFGDYFYIVADLIQEMRKVQIVGPGRGSSAGSLVAYLLQITRIDPIKYGLMFERFLDPSRTDSPDIDIDFSDRDLAVEYLKEKYGAHRVAKLGTLANWKTVNTVNEVAKQLDIPRFAFNSLVDSVPEYSAGDSRADTALAVAMEGHSLLSKYPELSVMSRIVGTPSHASQHAAGVVLTQEPLDQVVAIDNKTSSIMADMHTAERLGLLKLDCLGLSTLTLIDGVLDQIGKGANWLDAIPLDDQAAFDVLNDGKFSGIFQFSGKALMELTKTTHVDNFSDLAALSALARPGASSGAATWVRRRKDGEVVGYPHPCLEPYLKDTLGVLCYQETIMKIARELCGFEWSEVTGLRKAIGKSMGAAAMAKYAEPFIAGLESHGVDPHTAQGFWNNVLESGSYAFNAAHSIAYGLVSYQTCYLKAHYPLEFAAACLTMQKDKENQIKFLRELDKEGVKYTPVDIEKSTDKWRVVDGNLLGPLQMIKGVGPKVVQQILSCRARGEDLPDNIKKKLTGFETEIDSLFEIEDALKKAGFWDKGFSQGSKSISHWQPNGTWQDVKFAGRVVSIDTLDENDEKRVAARIERGQVGVKSGPTKFLQIKVEDSTGEILVKINANEYESRAPRLTEALDVGSLVCVNGVILPDFVYCLNKASDAHGIWRI